MKLTEEIVEGLFAEDGKNDQEEHDDLAISRKIHGQNIKIYVCNLRKYGYVTDKHGSVEDNFAFLRMEHLLKGLNGVYNSPLPVTEFVEPSLKKKRKTKLSFNQISVINLERRPDRRMRIEAAMDDLNIASKIFKAVDSRKIDEEYLKNLSISVLPNYRDPYSDRFMNYGEIACFLSHYFLWEEMLEKNLEKTLILEDDARFDKNFKAILTHTINQMNEKKIDWDLMLVKIAIFILKHM